MSNARNRASGIAEQIGGRVRRVVGALIGDDEMEDDGRTIERRGQLRRSTAEEATRADALARPLVGPSPDRIPEVFEEHLSGPERPAGATKNLS